MPFTKKLPAHMAIDPLAAAPTPDAPTAPPVATVAPMPPDVPVAAEHEPAAAQDAPQGATGPLDAPAAMDVSPTSPFVPQLDILCAGCGGVLVHHDVAGVPYLSVYERQLLRPHRLSAEDFPLDWRCQQCGHQQSITKQ